jgi:flagellar biosynthesis protein FlhA
VIINFVVVTKGASRISEVSARFTLDAMPGKQMAIDADLNAGLVNQDEARQRRTEVSREADFYGAMDGAGKFVRGDAVAGILILLVNLLGGIAVGVLQHGLKLSEAGRVYALLTVGDGLVAQVPALVLSTAAAIMVTRVSSSQDMGREIMGQLFDRPKSLGVTAAILGTIGVVPGMPNVAFLSLAAAAGYGAWSIAKRRRGSAAPEPLPEAEAQAAPRDLSWEDVNPVDPIGLEIGYRLIPLVDKRQGGQLMARIKGVRKKLSQDLGFLVPPVHIRDNLDLAPSAYRITLLGVVTAQAEIQPDREMAINPGQVFGSIEGTPTRDPVFGLEAVWIAPERRDQAQTLGYTVVDASTVVATHLNQVLTDHAHHLLGYDEVQQLLERLGKSSPKLAEDLVPKLLPLGAVVKVLQSLLEEHVPIRDIRTIGETLAGIAPRSQEPAVLTAAVRQGLSRMIVQKINGLNNELQVIVLAPRLEQILLQSAQAGSDPGLGLEPGLAETLQRGMRDSAQRQETMSRPAVFVVSQALRSAVSRFARQVSPQAHVLAWNEVPDDREVRIVATVGAPE